MVMQLLAPLEDNPPSRTIFRIFQTRLLSAMVSGQTQPVVAVLNSDPEIHIVL